VSLDERAAEFGITRGNIYQLHLFFAERHMKDSDFSIETTIADPGACE
jgi:fibro-slime domain-containing protein